MATNFPANLDALTNPSPTSDTVTVPHSAQHANANDAIEALEAKVGVSGSAVTTSHDYKLGEVTGTDKAVGKSASQTLLNKILGTGSKIILGSDAVGDIWYATAANVLTRLGIGSIGQVLTSDGTKPIWSSPSETNFNYAADSGAANAYVVNLSPALSAYAAGVLVQFKATNANTTASTVNVNGLGVKTIKKAGGATDLASGDIAAGMIVELEYDGTNFIMLNPVANQPLLPNGDGSGLSGVQLTSTNYHITTTVVASANPRGSYSDSASSTLSAAQTTYTKFKEIVFTDVSGTITATWTVSLVAGGSGLPYTKIYVNGSAVGAEKSTTGSLTESGISVSTGDLIQVYGHMTGGDTGTYNVNTFRLKYDKSVVFTPDYATNTVNL